MNTLKFPSCQNIKKAGKLHDFHISRYTEGYKIYRQHQDKGDIVPNLYVPLFEKSEQDVKHNI